MADEPATIYVEDRTAGAYLTQSRNALLDCGSHRRLYGKSRVTADTEDDDRVDMHFRAQTRQLEAARTSILFSALSAEAYINGFLQEGLEPSDFEGVERLSTVDKFVLGPELTLGTRLFERGAEPAQTIGSLFRLRHDLVHPKGRRVAMDSGTLMDTRFERFNPESAAGFVIAVAGAAAILAENTQPAREPDAIVRGVLRDRAELERFGTAMRESLPAPLEWFGKDPPVAEPYRPVAERYRLGPTVPQEPLKFLDVLGGPGTATAPNMPEVGYTRNRREQP